jgi:NTE family protein
VTTAVEPSGSPASRSGPEPAFSLVLGAGGRPGLAYHAGTLLALELHGLRVVTAVSVTGTSAGSVATAVLAAGGTVEDLAAHAVGAAPRPQFHATHELIRRADARRAQLDLRALGQLFDLRRVLTIASHVRARRMVAALTALVPGVLDITRRFDFLDAMVADASHLRAWRIVAVDNLGCRHVFPSVGLAPLSLAVAASCAVPGIFAAVRHEGRRLCDGGVHSTTNADLAVEDASDLVIVIAPMGTRPVAGESVSTPADSTLAREVSALEAVGKRVVAFRPSRSLREVMGRNPLARRRSRDIAAAAFLEAAEILTGIAPGARRSLPA